MSEPFIYFFYRTHYEGVLGRRLIKLPVASILEWFQDGWAVAQNTEDDLYEWVSKELAGSVYGLASIFQEAREQDLIFPETWEDLEEHLQTHLYVENEVRFDGRTLRAFTDDDELDLAYYFFEPGYAEDHPAEVCYLLTDSAEIPSQVNLQAVTPFQPKVKTDALLPIGEGEGTLYGCFFCYYDSMSILSQERPFRINGIRLNGFLDYLKMADVVNLHLEYWPREMCLMRALVEDSETSLANLFKRSCVWFKDEIPRAIGSRQEARQLVEDRMKVLPPIRAEVVEALHDEEHFFLFSAQIGDGWNFQFFLFDDVWAGAHPDLANSILKYCSTWDPFSDEP